MRPNLAQRARRAFLGAIGDCDPEILVRRATLGTEPSFVISVGKAACSMARGVPRTRGGILVAPDGARGAPRGLRLLRASHPIPDERSLGAARSIRRFISRLGSEDRLLLLLSGGASALVCEPLPGISLASMQRITRTLMRAGAPIRDLNCVRKHLDAVKGGRLALETHARLRVLVLSDVVGDDGSSVGSGPAAPDPTTLVDAHAIAKRAGVVLPAGARETPKPDHPAFSRVSTKLLGSHELLVRAAARRLRVPSATGVADSVETLAVRYGAALRAGRSFVAGGEPTLRVVGRGLGGRAQHLALLVAKAIAGQPGVAFLAAGSDGRDGPTDAAGAVVTGSTWLDAVRRGLRPERALRRCDSHTIHAAMNTHIHTGPTGNNLLDLHVGLVGRYPR